MSSKHSKENSLIYNQSKNEDDSAICKSEKEQQARVQLKTDKEFQLQQIGTERRPAVKVRRPKQDLELKKQESKVNKSLENLLGLISEDDNESSSKMPTEINLKNPAGPKVKPIANKNGARKEPP